MMATAKDAGVDVPIVVSAPPHEPEHAPGTEVQIRLNRHVVHVLDGRVPDRPEVLDPAKVSA